MWIKTRAILTVSLLLAGAAGAHAGGAVTNCTEQALRAALAGGGVASFSSDCSITLSAPLAIGAGATTIDSGGHNVTLSGGGTNQIFNVNGNLNLYGLTLAGGYSTNGGALYVGSGAVLASNCTFIGNTAAGLAGATGAAGSSNATGNGGDGGPGGAGTPGLGGAIYNLGSVTLLRCMVVSNTASGGNGGTGGAGGNGAFNQGNGGNGGAGATGAGGGVFSVGYLEVSNCTFFANSAAAGAGGAGGTNGTGAIAGVAGTGGGGGNAYGGAIHNGWQAAVVNSSTFYSNSVLGGASANGGTWPDGNGRNGPAGGVAAGGGVCIAGAGMLTNCTFYTNAATGGKGGNGGPASMNAGNGGNGGDGRGAGLYNASTTVAVNCTFSSGSALGGTNGVAGSGTYAGSPGSPGLNAGGDVANGAGTCTILNCALGSAAGGCGWGAITDGGYNISADVTLALSGTSSANTDPRLVVLTDNGGPAKTMALQTNSPCRDRIPAALAPAADQRGFPRPINTLSDVGAYEFERASAPLFIAQPADQVVLPGASVRFTVGAIGATPLGYQWQFQGAAISGATGASYTTTAALTNEGPYAVTVSNSAGSAVSRQVYFHLQPALVSSPVQQAVLPGGTAAFSASAAGDAPLFYQWQRDGIDIGGATNTTYTVSNALPADAGAYAVRVWNAYGTNTAGAALGILPVVTAQPVDQNIPAGSPVSFTVAATGSTPLNYQWRFNGTPISGATLTGYTIAAVQATNAGRYDVVVSNGFGSTNSYAVLLKVLYPLSGAVTEKGVGLAGVTVPIDATQTVTSDVNGNFTALVSAGAYTLVPSRTNYSFQPASLTVSIPPSTNVSFVAARAFTISGAVTGVNSNAPIRVTVIGAATNITVLASGGRYAVPGLAPGSYTLFPSVYCYAFTNRQVTITSADMAGLDFAAAPDVYLVTGRVTAGGLGVAGVTLAAGTFTAQTDASGYYTLAGLCPSNYTVTPSFPCHSFTPANRAVTVGPSVGDVNFETYTNGVFAIRGRVTTNGVGLAGVSLTAGDRAAVTDSNGYYALPSLCPGTYNVVAALDGFNFSPAPAKVTIQAADATANFAGVPSFRITGLVTLQGAAVPLTETLMLTATSTATNLVVTTTNGSYAFVGLPAGTYTVTPTLNCYLFTPANQSVTVASTNPAPTANFSALHDVHGISGTIIAGSAPLAGVPVVAASLFGSTTSYTDAAGYYAFTNLCSGAYTISPAMPCTVFYPSSRFQILSPGLPDVTQADFSGYRNVFILRGQVTEIETGRGLNGVVVTAGGQTAITTNGSFTIAGLCPGSTDIQPSLPGYLFDPPVITTNLSSDLSPVFTAVPLGLSFSLSNAVAALSFGAPPAVTSEILISSNLVSWDQVLVTNNTLGKVVWVKFLDAAAGSSPQRFYRVTEAPYLSASRDSTGASVVSFGTPPSMVYRIEASSDFVHWEGVYTNLLSAEPAIFEFADPAGTNVPIRFYRALP